MQQSVAGLFRRSAQTATEELSPVFGKLWVFAVLVLGVLCITVGSTSIFMHFNQSRLRTRLRRRIENGEVNLMSLGVRQTNVPQPIIDKMPLYVYTSPEDAPSLHISDEEDKDEQGMEEEGKEEEGKEEEEKEEEAKEEEAKEEEAKEEEAKEEEAREEEARDATSAPQSFTSAQRKALPRRVVPLFQPTCSICLDDFIHDETIVRELPCQHIFHPECVDDFLLKTTSLCPMCKVSALPKTYCPPVITMGMIRRDRAIRRRNRPAAAPRPQTHRLRRLLPPHVRQVLDENDRQNHTRRSRSSPATTETRQVLDENDRQNHTRRSRSSPATTETQAPNSPPTSTTSSSTPPPPAPDNETVDLEMGPLDHPSTTDQPPTQPSTLENISSSSSSPPTTRQDPSILEMTPLPPEIQDLSPEERREWGRQRLAATLLSPNVTDGSDDDDDDDDGEGDEQADARGRVAQRRRPLRKLQRLLRRAFPN
jgi:hypothetical protein